MQYRKALLLNVYLLVCAVVAAQQYPFVHYTPKDGLINSRVRKAYQDSKGRMYFTTYGGLSVYDGARFKNYTTQNGLLADLVNDVLEVGEDSLLVAANTCGLNVLVHGQMKELAIAKGLCPVINQFLKSNDGNVYATTDDGLYKVSSTAITKLNAIIPGQNIPAVYLGNIIEHKDFLIFTTNDLRKHNGLFLYDKKRGGITDALPDIYIYSLRTDHNSRIWLSTDKTIALLDSVALQKGKLVFAKPNLPSKTGTSLPGGVINFNSQNEFLLSLSNSQILHYRKDGTVQHISSPELPANQVLNFFIDREDVLWVCHDGNGVYKLPGTKFQTLSSPFSNNRSGIRSVSGITPVSWWLLMWNGQMIFQTDSGSRTYTVSPSFEAYFLHPGKKNFYASDPHNLYIAATPKENESILRFRKIASLPDTAAFGGLSVTDKYGNIILFETRHLYVMHDDQLLFKYPLIRNDLVEGIHIDKNDRLWVISRYDGLMMFTPHPETANNYLKKEAVFINEFEGGSPRSMVFDHNGIIWVGTRYKGLMGFKYKNNQLKKVWHFQTQDGLTDNFVTSLACDRNNNIIIGTQTGLDRLIKTKENYQLENITKSNNTFTYINYVWTDGLNNAFAWTTNGDILQAEPVTEIENIPAPQLLLEEIKINGRSIALTPSVLRLNYRQRNITFSVAAPSFIDEKQIKYSYLLSGSGHKEWSDTTTLADISLLNLSPGNYTLQVKAFFPSTAYSSKEIEFSFSILPPWWQTWWFRTGIGILGIGLLITAIRFYYRRKLEKQKTLLEKQQAIEKERTRIASDMHDDLGAGLSTIRFLSEKVKRNSFSDVTKDDSEKIVTNSNELMQKMNEIIWAMNEKNDTLEDLIFYTRSYAMEYCHENQLACETHLPGTIPSLFVSGEIRRNIFLTIKESLHNIIKHAGAKKVTIDFVINDSLAVTIKDDGKGFAREKNNGNGLRNMKKRIESVNGSLDIMNNNGVIVKMKIPLPL
ncbi:MAG: hypothetical protein HOP10_11415 [Chitinophagaceae bacterium]|nr:hypothetical protein [Chitinophagaceae bacterium]